MLADRQPLCDDRARATGHLERVVDSANSAGAFRRDGIHAETFYDTCQKLLKQGFSCQILTPT